MSSSDGSSFHEGDLNGGSSNGGCSDGSSDREREKAVLKEAIKFFNDKFEKLDILANARKKTNFTTNQQKILDNAGNRTNEGKLGWDTKHNSLKSNK